MAFDETMNNTNTNTSLLEELIMKTSDDCHHHQDYDALSFCDLPIDNYIDLTDHLQPLSDTCPKTTPPAGPTHVAAAGDRLFEFMTSPDAHHARADSIVFCGKTIVPRKEAVRGGRRKTDDKPREKCSGSGRSGLFRLGGGGSHSRPGSPASCSPWRSPKVEAVEVAKGRRSPARKLPATGGGAEGRMSSGGAHRDGHHHHHHNNNNNNNNNNNHWRGLLKPLRCGASFMSALTKAAFGLIPHV